MSVGVQLSGMPWSGHLPVLGNSQVNPYRLGAGHKSNFDYGITQILGIIRTYTIRCIPVSRHQFLVHALPGKVVIHMSLTGSDLFSKLIRGVCGFL